MYKLVVVADPMQETEIYEITQTNKMHKISQLRIPQESITFIKNYSDSVKEKVDVTYIGPKDYIKYFISQANKLNFINAHAEKEIGEQID